VTEAVRDLPEQVVLVDHVIRDRDDVVSRLAEEVHDLGNRELPVGPPRVDVQVGEQHVGVLLGPAESGAAMWTR
jgi:hypothetical protein